MFWLFDPSEPNAWPTQAGLKRDGRSAGDITALAGHWRIDVRFKEPPETSPPPGTAPPTTEPPTTTVPPTPPTYYADAAGEHVLHRYVQLKGARHPYHNPDLFPEVGGLDFETHRNGIAYWDAPSKTEDEVTVKWRMAFGWPWSRWNDIDASFAGLDDTWTIWFGPAFWLAKIPEELNIALPLYTSDRVRGRVNLFDGLRRVTLEKHPIGNGVIPGVFDFPEFPDELTIEPWWP